MLLGDLETIGQEKVLDYLEIPAVSLKYWSKLKKKII
jgi:hypothetical protein